MTASSLVFALAQLASRIGRPRESTVLFGAHIAYREGIGWDVLPTSKWWHALRDELTVALDADEFEALMAEGRSLDIDAAALPSGVHRPQIPQLSVELRDLLGRADHDRHAERREFEFWPCGQEPPMLPDPDDRDPN